MLTGYSLPGRIVVNTPLTTAAALSGYPKTPSEWASKRAGLISCIYNGDKPITGVDHVEVGYAGFGPLPGCARMDRYIIDDPGGRSGGTVQYSYLLRPSATESGTLVLFLAGHNPAGVGFETDYCYTDGSSVILGSLALGHWVVVVEMPQTGHQPTPQSWVVGGVLRTIGPPPEWGHDVGALDSDGGPLAMRMFLDTPIRAITQATTDLSTSHVYAAGHSGGGCIASFLSSCDDRIEKMVLMHGGAPQGFGPQYTCSISDWEQWLRGIMYEKCWGDFGGLALLGASTPGRKTLVTHSMGDNELYLSPASNNTLEMSNYYLSRSRILPVGCELQFYMGPTYYGAVLQGHMPSVPEVTRIMQFLA
jgi:hypothetical protein